MRTCRHAGLKPRRGAALLLTLWCLAIVSITVVMIARMVDSDVAVERTRSRKFEARQLAFTGIAHGMNPNLRRDSELLHQKNAEGGEIAVRITSENARLNINLLLQQPGNLTLKRLFTLWGVPQDVTSMTIDSLVDWTDAGDLRQLNGAEREDLQNQTAYSIPRNRPFQSIDEMQHVRGMDIVAQFNSEWRDCFSVFSGAQTDIQDASGDVLRAAGGFSGAQVEALMEIRNGKDKLAGTPDDYQFDSLDDVIQRIGLSDARAIESLRAGFMVGGEPMRIQSTAWVGGVVYRIQTVVNRTDKPKFLDWSEL